MPSNVVGTPLVHSAPPQAVGDCGQDAAQHPQASALATTCGKGKHGSIRRMHVREQQRITRRDTAEPAEKDASKSLNSIMGRAISEPQRKLP